MKKKSKTPSIAAATTTVNGGADDNIKSLIKTYSSFFDKLVESIPARFYLPSKDDKPWFQGLSKAKKASAKRKTINNLRIARKNRFDPEKSWKTTVDVLNESLKPSKKGKLGFSSDEEGEGDDDEGKMVTYEELQEKMRRKVEALQAGRARGEGYERRVEKRAAWKRKRDETDDGKTGSKKKVEGDEEKGRVEKEVEEALKEIEFGKVKLVSSVDDALNKKNKKRKLSKEQELKRARELQEAKNDPEMGEIVKTKHAWKAATDRAMGIKVHDNPAKLQKSLDNETRKQKKSKETWKQRVETTANHQRSKQEKRKANITAKANTKKQAKIAKREKKFMRPGFEGRKDGFITKE